MADNDYKVLYRKYRPTTFGDVVGQKGVVRVLTNQLVSSRTSHAYIFSGSRGTGKTSCARILAKAVNCASPLPDGSPCCSCESCLSIDSGAAIDVLEMNASSQRGIDDVRALEEAANTPPASLKKRVFIIDEFHMLTREAFNALLKTLEEPPDFVLFILCTTDIQMVPDTILSRCQRFTFTRIEPDVLASRLMYIAGQENVELTPQAAALISSIADGGMRDAVSLLDLCSAAGGVVDDKVVAECAGIADRSSVYRIISCANGGDVAGVLETFAALHDASSDDASVCSELIDEYHNLAVLKTVKEPSRFIAATKEQLDHMLEIASGCSLESILRAVEILSDAKTQMYRSDVRRAVMETALIRLCVPQASEDTASLELRVSELEKRAANGGFGPAEGASGAVRNAVPERTAGEYAAEPALPDAASVPEPAETTAAEEGAGQTGFSLPFDDEEDAPAPDQPAPASEDRALTQKETLNIIMTAENAYAPLTGFLNGTVWRITGGGVRVTGCQKPVVTAWERNKTAQSAISDAVKAVLGREYNVKLSV
ncbi:MAG: DNA polymerase III subunit gamma/tau [Clostridia bacterium]|nr:DNA polymerase III subunit gamma/tau [Clostridia bacterium]